MKKVSIQLALTAMMSVMIFSCNSSQNKNEESSEQNETTVEGNTNLEENNPNPSSAIETPPFDINSIPISTADIGDFPFFSLPQDMKEQNKAINRKYDMLFFPIDGKMRRLEGKVWKSNIVSSKSYDDWSLAFFQKSYDDAITAVGGVKIFEGKVSKEEIDRIEEEATYFGEEGSVDYWNEPVRVYVIRRENGDDVYIQLSGNTAGGELQILQKEAFKQTITKITSDEIKKDLLEKGKAVLHIHFDTNKATLKPAGLETVGEIIKVLKGDPALKIAIHGYTDNSGSKEHNQTLSENRALSVKNEIAKAGIAADRLTSKGFGQDSPVADNGTEQGKAQNRRVELVKI